MPFASLPCHLWISLGPNTLQKKKRMDLPGTSNSAFLQLDLVRLILALPSPLKPCRPGHGSPSCLARPRPPRYQPWYTGSWSEPAGDPIWCFLFLGFWTILRELLRTAGTGPRELGKVGSEKRLESGGFIEPSGSFWYILVVWIFLMGY